MFFRKSVANTTFPCGIELDAWGSIFDRCTFKDLSKGTLPECVAKKSSFFDCTFVIDTADDAKAFIREGLIYVAQFWPSITVLDPNGHLSKLVSMKCPETGSFCGYKKTKYLDEYDSYTCVRNAIAVLLIPEDAKRSSAFGNKCRCSKAKVIDIYDLETGKRVKKAWSLFDTFFSYHVGETVEVKDFDEDRWHECAPGIHFFMTEKEAMAYQS